MRRIGTAALAIPALPTDDDWRTRAACGPNDADTFFPDRTLGTGPAKQICAACPVTATCAQWALDTRQEYGVFGGIDERERRRILRAAQPPKPMPRGGRPQAPCGTRAAYDRHRRNGEEVDNACASARYSRPLTGADQPPAQAA